MIEIETLENIGFSNKEAAVFVALLELGPASVGQVAQKSAIKRPTVYVVLDELIKKGFVSKSAEKKGIYIAEDPTKVLVRFQTAVNNYRELLPFFKTKFTRSTKPVIRYYDDKESIRELYLNEVFPSPTVYFYGTSIGEFKKNWPDLFDVWEKKWWPKKTKTGQVLELVGNKPEDIAYAKSLVGKREVRILPKGKKFLADNVVTENRVVITSFEPLFSISIESPQLAETYRALVELAWTSAVSISDLSGRRESNPRT